MARVRTFIAIELAPGVRDRLASLQSKLVPSGSTDRWVRPENLHLTLLFLGEVERLDVVPVCRVVQKRARRHSPFAINVHGLGAFPNARRPKTIWAGIAEGTAELKALHDDLEEGLLELGGYRQEDRGYTPHLTLGRLSAEDRGEEWTRLLEEYANWPGGTSPVDEVVVMSSQLRNEGPEYSILGRGKLGSAAKE